MLGRREQLDLKILAFSVWIADHLLVEEEDEDYSGAIKKLLIISALALLACSVVGFRAALPFNIVFTLVSLIALMELMLAQLVKSTFKQYHEMVSQRETDVRDLQVFVGGAVFTVGGLAAIPAIPVEGKALALMGFGMVLSIMAIGYLIRIPGKPKKRQRAKALKPALNPN